MKKIICIILSILLVFSLMSCDKAKEKDNNGIIVYVSRYGKYHSTPNCSGMIHYKTMTLYDAINEGNVVCKKCEEGIKKDLEEYYNNHENFHENSYDYGCYDQQYD